MNYSWKLIRKLKIWKGTFKMLELMVQHLSMKIFTSLKVTLMRFLVLHRINGLMINCLQSVKEITIALKILFPGLNVISFKMVP